jgi:hypothetical protein
MAPMPQKTGNLRVSLFPYAFHSRFVQVVSHHYTTEPLYLNTRYYRIIYTDGFKIAAVIA